MIYPLIPIFLLFATTLLPQAESPKQGTLATDTQLPLVMDGKTVGTMPLKAGVEITILQVLPDNEGVLISRGETATTKIPAEALSTESPQAAQQTGLPEPLYLRGQSHHPISFSGRATLSLRRRRTTHNQPDTLETSPND